LGALPVARLLDLDSVFRLVDEMIPPSHRTRLPVELDLGLATEAGVARWRLQYEIEGVGFRVAHLDAINGSILYDRFDEWRE